MQIAYRVREGETLESICKRFRTSREVVQGENKLIEVRMGQMIVVNVVEREKYRVMPHDTVESIATKYGINAEKLLLENSVTKIYIGQQLVIPR